MRRSLEHILSCTLDTLNVSQEMWKENQDKRTHQIFMVKQTFALIACEMEGYSRTEVGKFLGKHHATIIHYIKMLKEQMGIYPTLQGMVDRVVARLDPLPQEDLTMHAWLARSSTGLLTISTSRPEKVGGFWIAEKNKTLPTGQFPQITFESGPTKVKIKITLDKEEE